jgi:hypothetical protein
MSPGIDPGRSEARRRLRDIITALMLAVMGGCAVTKVPVPMGGSRADGVVQMAYEYGGFERPRVDLASARVSAAQRCAAWGYRDAEPFGGYVSHCEASNEYGCLRYLVTIQYQCTGPEK